MYLSSALPCITVICSAFKEKCLFYVKSIRLTRRKIQPRGNTHQAAWCVKCNQKRFIIICNLSQSVLNQLSLLIVSWTQYFSFIMSAYTPYFPLRPHPIPQLTAPIRYHLSFLEQTSGPPLSP